MKLKIEKKLEGGVYKVEVHASSFTTDEIQKMSKFGSPTISILPLTTWHAGSLVNRLPVHALGNTFQFDKEEKADKFVSDMQARVKAAMEELRSKTEKFTVNQEYEL